MHRSASGVDDLTRIADALNVYDLFGGDMEILNSCIIECSTALEDTSHLLDVEQSARWWILKASALRLRFEQEGSTSDMTEAQGVLEGLVASGQSSEEVHILSLYHLGRVFESTFDGHGGNEAIHLARERYSEAYRKAEEGHVLNVGVKHCIALYLAGATCTCMYSQPVEEPLPILTNVIGMLQAVLQSIEDGDPLRPLVLAKIVAAYRIRFEFGGCSDQNDLLRSDKFGRQAVRLSLSHRARPYILYAFCGTCMERFQFNGTVDVLKDGIAYGNEAVELIMKSGWLKNRQRRILVGLGTTYKFLYFAEGRLEDLDSAVTKCRIGADGAGEGSTLLDDNLALALFTRFMETGQSRDIDEAVAVAYRAFGHLSPDNPLYPRALVTCGNALTTRFIHGGSLEDYQSARPLLEEAVERCKANDFAVTLLGSCHQILSLLHNSRFQTTSQPEDLDLAVFHSKSAIETEGDDYFERPYYLSDLGDLYLSRYRVHAREEDLVASVAVLETALRLPSTIRSQRHVILCRWSRALRIRFQSNHAASDIEQSIEAAAQAVQSLGSYHAQRAFHLAELASSYAALHGASQNEEDLGMALGYYLQASQALDAYINDRFRAAVAGARLACSHGRHKEATEAFSIAIALLPRIAWLGLNAVQRQAKLASSSAHLGCDAAACAISIGELRRAVELLEEGRSIFWRSMLQLRTDLQDLKRAAPDLAAALLDIGKTLEHDDSGHGSLTETSVQYEEERAQRRRRLAEEWEALVGSVREIEGFQDFLKPISFEKLQRAADGGPVVILNVSAIRSDALILNGEGVHSVPLFGLDYATVRQMAYVLQQALHVAKDRQGCAFLERILLDIARRLWHGGMSAVAATLVELHGGRNALPFRVWWLPTGPLSLLPVHCSGPYEIGQKGIPDLFISSYTTTMDTLIRASRPASDGDSIALPRVLAVGQPDVPGLPRLTNTEKEQEILATSPFADRVTVLYREQATVDGVCRALPDHRWIHLCCHGRWDVRQPLSSALLLGDGALTLSRIVQMRLTNAEFAYLSACHTARHGIHLPDESMNIAAAMQLAGFRGALATSWGMIDQDGPALARLFYGFLVGGGRALDARNAAEALHRAITELRGAGMPLYRWACFVHIGI